MSEREEIIYTCDRCEAEATVPVERLTAAALAAIAAYEAAQWQPIESAPRDGTRVLVCTGPVGAFKVRRYYVTHWLSRQHDRFGNGWSFDGDGFINPTHWRPLPPPPETKP